MTSTPPSGRPDWDGRAPREVGATRVSLGVTGVAVVAVVLAVGVALTRDADGDDGLHVDPDVVASSLERLTAEDGRVELPLQLGEPSLEMSAWTRDLSRQAGVEPPPLDPSAMAGLLREADPDLPAWTAYWAFLASGDAASAPAVAPLLQADGTFVADPRLTVDHALVAMSTWAAVTVDPGAASPETAVWASAQLEGCRGNAFTQVHVAQVLAVLDPSASDRARTALARCIDGAGVATAPVSLPRNEDELLTLVGNALALDAVGWPAPSDEVDYRDALVPASWAWVDPWWAHHSMRGYVAAGGSAEDYSAVAQSWEPSFDDDGLMPQILHSVPSLEQDLFAALTADRLGVDWSGLPPATVLALPDSDGAVEWGDAESAMWGLLAYLRSAQLSESEAMAAAESASRCAAGNPAPGGMRQWWLCREAAQALGARVDPAPAVPWSFFDGLALGEAVEAAVLLEPSGVPEPVRSAVDEVAAAPGSAPTHTVAQVLILADRHPGLVDDVAPLVAALERVRARDDLAGLYVAGPGAESVDMYATFWVSAAERELSE